MNRVDGDQIIEIGSSKIQHGNSSDRIYLMEASDDDMPQLLDKLHQLAGELGYGKIFAKVEARWRKPSIEAGFKVEAEVPGFFRGRVDGLFLGKYLDPEREKARDDREIKEILALCRKESEKGVDGHGRPPKRATGSVNPGRFGQEPYELRLCGTGDCREMATLFKRVFPSYPFPVHDPDFLRRSMEEEVCYAGVWSRDGLAALASAEYSTRESHAEMTDFATSPEHRGRRLAPGLLNLLESAMEERGVKTAYTIARAISPGINLTFARAGYRYAGTLINNTQICGRIESMNIWYRPVTARQHPILRRSE